MPIANISIVWKTFVYGIYVSYKRQNVLYTIDVLCLTHNFCVFHRFQFQVLNDEFEFKFYWVNFIFVNIIDWYFRWKRFVKWHVNGVVIGKMYWVNNIFKNMSFIVLMNFIDTNMFRKYKFTRATIYLDIFIKISIHYCITQRKSILCNILEQIRLLRWFRFLCYILIKYN